MKGPRLPVALAGAQALLHGLNNQEPGFNDTDEITATLNEVGDGRVLAVPSAFFTHFAATHYPRTRALVGEFLAALAPDFLAELDAPARLQLVLRRQGDRLIAHLVNLSASHPLSPQQVMVEEVPPVGPVTLRVKLPERPARVYLAPSMEGLAWDWRDGLLTAQVQSVGILDSVVIE